MSCVFVCCCNTRGAIAIQNQDTGTFDVILKKRIFQQMGQVHENMNKFVG